MKMLSDCDRSAMADKQTGGDAKTTSITERDPPRIISNSIWRYLEQQPPPGAQPRLGG
jgi:hypothetical protein